MKGKAPTGSHKHASPDYPTGTPSTQSLLLEHFPEYNPLAPCHLMESDHGVHKDIWQFCLIGCIAGKFLGFTSLIKFISNSWKCKVNFSMHDSGWLIFSFSSKLEMFEVLGGGPYFVFGQPLILKVMLEFFYFTTSNMVRLSV